MKALHLLVVDDEENSREVLKAYLTMLGHVVDTATSGEEALSGPPLEEYDCFILDRTMVGGMNGEQLALQLKAQHPTTQVVMCTGDQLDAQPPGVDLLWRKPLCAYELFVIQCIQPFNRLLGIETEDASS